MAWQTGEVRHGDEANADRCVCTATVLGVGAGSAFGGEVTGNGKPTQGPAHANSICTFSGQNDDPNAPIVPPGPTAPNGPGGRTQSYGQDVRNGLSEPSAINPGKVGQGVLTFHPGFACNGDHGFFAEGGEE
jgi:hypothetical protein